MFTCPFCNKNNDMYESIGDLPIFQCYDHIGWIIEYTPPAGIFDQSAWIALFNSEYLIDINLVKETTWLFQDVTKQRGEKDGRYELILTLDSKLPITPENVNQMVQRLLNLKAFS